MNETVDIGYKQRKVVSVAPATSASNGTYVGGPSLSSHSSDPAPASSSHYGGGVHHNSSSALSPLASRGFISPGRTSTNPTTQAVGGLIASLPSPGMGGAAGPSMGMGSSTGTGRATLTSAAGAMLVDDGRAAAFAQLKDALIAVTDEAESLRGAVHRYEESNKARAGLDEQVKSTLLHSEDRIAQLQKELQQEKAALQRAKEDVRRAKGELLSGQQQVRQAGNEQSSSVLQAQLDSLTFQVRQLEQEKQRLEGVVARGRSAALANAVRSNHPGAYFEPVFGAAPSGEAAPASPRDTGRAVLQIRTSPSDALPPTSPTPSSSPGQQGASPEERQGGEGAGRPPLSKRKSARGGQGLLTAMLLPGMTAVRRGSFSSIGAPTPKARAGSMSGGLGLRASSPLPPSAAGSRRESLSGITPLAASSVPNASAVLTAPQPDPAILQAAVTKAIRDTLYAVFGSDVPTIEDARSRLQALITDRVQAGESISATQVVVQSHTIDQLKRELREMTAQYQMSQDDARRAQAERLAMGIQLHAAQDKVTSLQRELEEAEAGAKLASVPRQRDAQMTSSASVVPAAASGEDSKRVQSLQDRVAALMSSETSARAQVRELKQHVEKLTEENERLQELTNEEKRAALQKENDAAIANLTQHLNAAREEMERAKAEAETAQAAFEAQKAAFTAAQKEAEAWKSEKQDLQQQVRGLEQGLVQGDREIKSLRSERDRLKGSLQQAEEALSRAVDKGRRDLDNTVEEGRAKERELLAEVDGERASRRAVEQRLEELESTLGQERAELHSALQQLQLAQASEQYMAAKLKEAQEDVSHGDQNLAKLQKQLNAAQRSIASLQMFVDGRSAEATAARASGSAVGTTGGLAGTNILQRTAMLEAEMRAAKEAAASARSELSTERARCTSLQAQLATLQAELQAHRSPASSPHKRAQAASPTSRLSFSAAAFSPGASTRSPEKTGLSAVMIASTLREDELLARVANMTQEVEQLKAEAEQGEQSMQRELALTRSSLMAAERARDLLQVDLDRLRSQQLAHGEAVHGEVSRLSTSLDQVQREREDLLAKVATQGASIDTLRASLQTAEGQVQRLSAQLEASNRDLSAAAKDIDAYKKAMVDTQYTRQHRTVAERRVAELEAELRSAKTELVSAQQKVRDLLLSADVNKAEIASSQAKMARMQQELAVAQAEAASARREVSSAQSSVTSLRETKQLLEGKVRGLEQDLYSPRR